MRPVVFAPIPLAVLGRPTAHPSALPVTGGVPFAKGTLRNLDHLTVRDPSGAPLPAQFDPLCRWEDGSIKAAVVSVLNAPARGLTLTADARPVRAARSTTPALQITRRAGRLTVNTGAARFDFHPGSRRTTPALVQITTPRDGALLAAPLALSVQGLNFAWYDAAGPGAFAVETAGPCRAVLRLSGRYCHRETHQPGLAWLLRFEFFAGCPFARLYHTLIDDDPRAMIRLRSVGLQLNLRRPAARALFGGEEHTPRVHTVSLPPAGERYLYQKGRPYNNEGLGYETTFTGVAEGRHAQGWFAAGGLALAVRHGWQQYPKEYAADRRHLNLWLFTDRAGEYFWSELPGIAKTHEILLGAGAALTTHPTRLRDLCRDFNAGPMLSAPPAHNLNTNVFPFLAVPDARSRDLDRLLAKRMSAFVWDAYGWKDFGDKVTGQSAAPALKHSFNNHHYEEPRTQFHQFLRSGDIRWFHQGEIGTRHFMDIDVQHSPGPNRYAEFSSTRPNHGPGFVWMHYSHDHQGLGHVSHFHLGGLSQYYLLTGNPRAGDILREVADYTAGLIENPPATFVCETLALGNFMRTAPQAHGYWGMSRDLGWLIHLMVQAYEATGNRRYPAAAAKIVKFLIRQWRTPQPHLIHGKKVGVHKPPRGCWAFFWEEPDGTASSGVAGWGTAIVLMAMVEFIHLNRRLKLLPARTLLQMAHENARYMAQHIWDKKHRGFRYQENGTPDLRRGYWPNSLYIFPIQAVARLTGDRELARVCDATYRGPLGLPANGRNDRFHYSISMWQTAHYLALAGDPRATP